MCCYDQIVRFWRDQHVTDDAQLAAVLNGQSILFAYNSGKLENRQITYHDTQSIFDKDGVSSYTGDLRTLFEIRNAKEAYEFFLQSYAVRRPVDEAFLHEMQRIFTQNTYDTRRWQAGERPGEYKHHDYVVGPDETGASPDTVEEEMQELLEELQDFPESQALTAAAYFHAKMENIHPFSDGNGRTGRLAMNYLLVLHAHPPVTIFEEDRKPYYDALHAWDTKQDLQPLIGFFKEQLYKTWGKKI